MYQFTLIRQSDGTYAFQTSSGYYLTANGGGAAGDFRTDAPQVGNWQKFTLTPNNACTYYVQAYNGYYLGITVGIMPDGTYINVPNTTSDISQAVRWRLLVYALAPTTQQQGAPYCAGCPILSITKGGREFPQTSYNGSRDQKKARLPPQSGLVFGRRKWPRIKSLRVSHLS
jgi:hypothetical protein